jgi:hypothetical protein
MPGAVKGYLLGYACRQEPAFEWSLQHLVLETVKDKSLVPFPKQSVGFIADGVVYNLFGLLHLAIIPALFFMIIPGIIISIGWSLAIYILLDKGVAPGEAMIRSNKATYGYKWTIFGVSFLLGLAFYVLMMIIFNIASGGFAMLLLFIIAIVYTVAALGCTAVIYRNLTAEAQPEATETAAEV